VKLAFFFFESVRIVFSMPIQTDRLYMKGTKLQTQNYMQQYLCMLILKCSYILYQQRYSRLGVTFLNFLTEKTQIPSVLRANVTS